MPGIKLHWRKSPILLLRQSGTLHMAGGLDRRYFVALAAAVALTGCPFVLPTPGLNEHGLNAEAVKKIAPNTSTRADVLMLIGDPDETHQNDRYFVYFWSKTHAIVGVAAGYGGLATGLSDKHALAIEFAPDGRVARLKEFTADFSGSTKSEGKAIRVLLNDVHSWMKAGGPPRR